MDDNLKIVVNIIATNKYTFFLDKLIPSIENFFLPGIDKTYLIHTDQEDIKIDGKYIIHKVEHNPWPSSTLHRFRFFNECKEIISNYNYSFYIDADSLFVGQVNPEDILSNVIGALHPHLGNNEGTPERNPNSTAYIGNGESSRYFCGGFFGAESSEFLNISRTIEHNINKDLENGIVAIWHDESHLNKYFLTNTPTLILPLGYAADENHEHPHSKIFFLDKRKFGGFGYFRN
jgi:histo-blood group ABO system transferase